MPAYIGDLVSSINDDAGKARTTALALLLTGLYLAATVIATTDEAMLRGSSREIPQIGVALPVVISYALAPLVFLFLHVSTLILFERVAQKLHFYFVELRRSVPEVNRAHCSNLLTGTVFVQGLAHLNNRDAGGDAGGRLFRFMSWLTVAGLPVAVLLAVQIDFVRYQQTTINLFQKTILVADLLLLVWFYLRLIGQKSPGQRATPGSYKVRTGGGSITSGASPAADGTARLRRLFKAATDRTGEWMPGPVQALRRLRRAPGFLATAAIALWLGFGHANVPDSESVTVGRAADFEIKGRYARYSERVVVPQSILRGENVLDRVFCPIMDWGCRYLRLRNRTLLAGSVERNLLIELEDLAVPEEVRSSDIRPSSPRDLKSVLRLVDGLFLRRRTLRFADFTGSKLYRADLIGADLRHATLTDVRLQGANLKRTWLRKVVLRGAELQGAILDETRLQDADLRNARLQGTDLRRTRLQGANLRRARLQDADLRGKRLPGADLRGAELQGADLSRSLLLGAMLEDARLQGANLRRAQLQGVNLQGARLQGADLRGAELQGANLKDARLQGANMAGARLQGARLQGARLQGASLEGSELQGANLERARLQGADLRFARLQGADFTRARLQGADLRDAYIRGAIFSAGAKLGYADLRRARRGRLMKEDFDKLKRLSEGSNAGIQGDLIVRFELRIGMNDNLPAAQLTGAYCAEPNLVGCGLYITSGEYYNAQSASVLETLACDGVIEPAVARAMARRAVRIEGVSEKGRRVVFVPYWHLAKALHTEGKCAGYKHFSQTTIRRLQKFTERYKPKGE